VHEIVEGILDVMGVAFKNQVSSNFFKLQVREMVLFLHLGVGLWLLL
jgi:hypothetical protein